MKGSLAVIPVLLLVFSQRTSAANNLEEAARELARRVAGVPARRAALTFRNLTSRPASEAGRARARMELALREAGVSLDPHSQTELRITLSENASRFLLAAETRREEERWQSVVSWPRGATGPAPSDSLTLDKKLLWTQAEAILDAVLMGDSLLVLSPSRLAAYVRRDAGWEPAGAAALSMPKPWPRDPRGRIRIRGKSLALFLPGAGCVGTWQPSPALACKTDAAPWELDAGGRYFLLAAFTEGRNYFSGKIVTNAGPRPAVPPFYSAAAVEEAGGPLWLFTGLDGRVMLAGSDREPAFLPGAPWGSDIAEVDARCGSGPAVLATRPGDEAEAIQAFAIVNRQPEPVSQPLAMPGAVTALWPLPGGAMAVARDSNSGQYGAYLLTVSCRP